MPALHAMNCRYLSLRSIVKTAGLLCRLVKTAGLLCCLLCLVSIGSCKDPVSPPIPCTTEYVYGLHIEIRDALTGIPVGEGATITVSDGDYEETRTAFQVPGPEVIAFAAGERPGTYDISVTFTGYKPWRTTGVRVRANECHVIPEEVLVEMENDR